jgi:uncharacterized sulfatase
MEKSMNRRNFVKSVTALGAASTLSIAAEATREPRQVIVILGESVRFDMLACNRQTGLKTPQLDRLASEGVRFEQAYCCQPVCAPSRSAIWTGLYPHTSGVSSNSQPLGETVRTIGQRLTDKGIRSAFIGKWHLDGVDYFGTGHPAPGWQHEIWYDMRDYLQELSPEDRVRSRNPASGEGAGWPAELTYAKRCTDRAVDFLSHQDGHDFFLALAFDEPHGPSLCPREFTDQYANFIFPASANLGDTLEHKPEEQRVWADGRINQLPKPIKASQFFGSHTFVDNQIGRVLDAIERHAPQALVIFTSDHGVFLDSHHLTDKGAAMYDEITRIPFLVKWPGKTPRNIASRSLVSHVDLSATLMDFFGFEVPKTLEGISMLQLFKTPSITHREQVFIEWGRYEVDHDGFGGFQPIRCVYDGRYKLSIHLLTTDELYDLHEDPGEMSNLIDSPRHAHMRDTLHDGLINQMNASRDPLRGYYWGNRPWRPNFPKSWDNEGMTRQRESDGYLPRELDYDTGLVMRTATRSKTADPRKATRD